MRGTHIQLYESNSRIMIRDERDAGGGGGGANRSERWRFQTTPWTTGCLPSGTLLSEWVTAHTNESRHIWMSHGTYEWVMAHMNESRHIWMSHGPYEWPAEPNPLYTGAECSPPRWRLDRRERPHWYQGSLPRPWEKHTACHTANACPLANRTSFAFGTSTNHLSRLRLVQVQIIGWFVPSRYTRLGSDPFRQKCRCRWWDREDRMRLHTRYCTLHHILRRYCTLHHILRHDTSPVHAHKTRPLVRLCSNPHQKPRGACHGTYVWVTAHMNELWHTSHGVTSHVTHVTTRCLPSRTF